MFFPVCLSDGLFFLFGANCLNLKGSGRYSSCWRRASNGRSNGHHATGAPLHLCTFISRTASAAVIKHEALLDVPETGFVSPSLLKSALRINEKIENSIFFPPFYGLILFQKLLGIHNSAFTHPAQPSEKDCMLTFLSESGKNRPYNEIAGVDEPAVLGALQVPRVPHHGAGSAALRAGVHVEHFIGDDLEQLLHHPAEVGWLPLRLQPLVTEQRQALRRGRGSWATFNKGSAGPKRTSGGFLALKQGRPGRC